ncbi:MAG TPA: hypothetical protein VIF15_15050 [Polyangiaceae bacterium]
MSRWTERLLATPGRRLVAIGLGGALVGALLVGSIGSMARGCGRGDRLHELDQRMARVEVALGMGDGEAPPSADTPPAGADAGPAEETNAACAVAKVAAYQAWQEAMTRAKALAAPAQASCADAWTDRKRQACYYAASTGVRTTQAARDAVIPGDGAARDTVKAVKDDPRNEAIARARAASDRAFAECHEESP